MTTSSPRSKRTAEILDAVDQARGEGHRVDCHCWGGIGRTGTVAG